ncbi:GNAT family N-acetyltransferase [Actinotalea sp. K2]|uniref:GNAT family N-acetyltransferase n=1 Tax=Actinotalea sp. K2 TaxID=2939438 RepID=UPI002016DCB2|nr:GNAT family N-acetyltransferase [Actinotalea sp. K2]MCL3861772.1 GNAT family N-acetyltransferase [Actinotalea sp. K2]
MTASSTSTTAWTITRAPVPPTLDHPDAWALHGAVAVGLAVDRASWGYDDIAYTAQYLVTKLREQEYATRLRLVATPADLDGRTPSAQDVVGTAHVIMPRRGNEHLVEYSLVVHPEHRRAGAGRALLAEVERIAAQHHRTTLIAESDHVGEPPATDPSALTPPTGSGRIAADDPGAVFARFHGYALEQAERYSVLHLPVDGGVLDRLHAEATGRAGTDYRLHAWTDRIPDEWAEQVAGLNTRMSTDAPMADLDLEEDPWDVDRVRQAESDIADAGHGYLLVAAEHVPSGVLAAFTMVEYPWDSPEVVFQDDTLVIREHRGRRLGMLVKAEMLRRLTALRPDARRIHTWNAEENAHMLGINVALGFRPTGVAGLWQKKLDRADPTA